MHEGDIVRLNGGSALRDSNGEDEVTMRFVRSAALGLAHFGREDLAEGRLCMLLALSAWLRFAGAGLPAACSGLLRLRRTLLELSELDRASEPVPLLAGEPRVALIGLATYLHGLIERAAAQSAKPKTELVEEALALLP